MKEILTNIHAKHLVILENDAELPYSVIRHLRHITYDEKTELTRLKSRTEKEILTALMTADVILSVPTLIYEDQNDFIARLLAIPALPPLKILLGTDDLEKHMRNMFTNEQIFAGKKHKIYSSEGWETWIPVDFSDIYIQEENKILADAALNEFLKDNKTGRKVQLLTIPGIEKSERDFLIKDHIYDEIDCSYLDYYSKYPNPGVWIWGQEQPIKLLDRRGFHEYKIVY